MNETARQRRVFAVGVACALFGTLIGAVSLLGWVLHNEALKGAFAAGITIKTNTAIGLFALGVALLMLAPQRRPTVATIVGRALAAFVTGLGLAILAQHVFGIDLGIDELLFKEAAGALSTSSPNRTGPVGSLCLALLGSALLVLDRPARRGRTTAQFLVLVALMFCFVSLIGYLFGIHEFYGVARSTGIALQTAIGIAALALGTLAARPAIGLIGRMLADDAGALLIRRLLPAAILLPILIGWLRVMGERAGLYDRDFGRVLLIILFIVLFTALTWWTGSAVTRQEAKRDASLREEDRRKNVFLATLAHELRNPLAPVRNAVQILRLKGVADADARWALEIIDRQVAHLARLIDDLMDVSRIAHNKLELQRARTSVADVIAAVVEAAGPALAESGHALRVAMPAEPLLLDADPVRLVQVFSNLLTNAIKYTPPGGRIAIEGRREGGEAVVTVIDSGLGIAAAQRGRLFEMFFQAEGEPGRAQGGLGIGLALVRHLVELHDGRVSARSEGEGRGSSFEVRLPLASGADPAKDGASALAPPIEVDLAGRRILVVDDNVDAAMSLGALLDHAGARVDLAHDGDAALARSLAGSPEIVILDLGLPRRSGYEVAAAIRASARTPQPILIALTGWGQEADRARSREAGFDHHLVKPVSPDALLALLAGFDGRGGP